jgi:hypothetical protein
MELEAKDHVYNSKGSHIKGNIRQIRKTQKIMDENKVI